MQHLPTILGLMSLPQPGSVGALVLWSLVKVACVVGILLTMVAYVVLVERKVSAFIQDRVGPNRVTFPLIGSIPVIGPLLTRMGIWQPLSAGLKPFLNVDFTLVNRL